jgi:hypothetical protein
VEEREPKEPTEVVTEPRGDADAGGEDRGESKERAVEDGDATRERE